MTAENSQLLDFSGVAPVKRWPWPIELHLGRGVHAVVGGPDDGTLAIAPFTAGLARPHRGIVRVDGRDPYRNPAVRRRIGTTLASPLLPAAPATDALLASRESFIASRPDLADLATALGPVPRLTPGALELLLALTTPDPLVVALSEPFAVAPRNARSAMARTLAALAERGALVLVITSSLGDAADAGGQVHRFERGVIAASAPAARLDAFLPGRGVELRIEAQPGRALVTQLGADPAVESLDFSDGASASVVRVRGADLGALGLAVARAALGAQATIRSITTVPPTLDELRAAAAGDRDGAYQGAHRAAYDMAYRGAFTSRSGPPGPTGAT